MILAFYRMEFVWAPKNVQSNISFEKERPGKFFLSQQIYPRMFPAGLGRISKKFYRKTFTMLASEDKIVINEFKIDL